MNIGILSNIVRENSINNNKVLGNSLEKLSTGLKINKANDDASGLAISDKLRTQATGIKQGIDNANSAIAMMNIADKSMDELSNILDTIKAKAIQMNTDTTSDEGRKIIKTDILKLIESYDDIVCRTNYNQTPLLNGCSSPFTFQVGDNTSDIISIDIDSVEARHMGEPDPYKLKNFITGFNMPTIPPLLPELDLDDILSSDVPGFENLDWIKNVDQTYSSIGILNLNGITDKLIDIDSNYIKNIKFIFNNFGAANERFTLKDGIFIIGEISGNNYSGNEIENVSLDTNYLDSWNYADLENLGLGTVELNNVKENISVYATGAILSLTKMVVTLQDNLPVIPTAPAAPSCGCDYTDLTRNDDSPTLVIQARNLMKVIDEALSQLNSQRANVGAGTNQLESSARNHLTSYVNLKNAESIIRDVDYSEESANFNKTNIISQAGSYALSQANEIDKQSVSALLK